MGWRPTTQLTCFSNSGGIQRPSWTSARCLFGNPSEKLAQTDISVKRLWQPGGMGFIDQKTFLDPMSGKARDSVAGA